MELGGNIDTLQRDETSELISSEKVNGTAVYSPRGDRLGSIKHFMVGKKDGRVRHAVLTFGGIFGIGERYYPLPWAALSYDQEMRGYVVDIDRRRLEKAPSYERGEEPAYDRAYGERVYGHYGMTY